MKRRRSFKKKKIKLFPDTDPNEGLDIWTFVLKDICPKLFFLVEIWFIWFHLIDCEFKIIITSSTKKSNCLLIHPQMNALTSGHII